jgi:serine/threonine-protein kinase
MAEVLLTIAHAGGGVWRLEVLKRIWPELATDPDFVTMFLDEARLSLRLNHPNVVQTHEVLTGQGQLAIVMEYLDGQPLTRVLNRLLRGPTALSLALRLRILMRVLAGLEHAHTLTDLDGSPLGVVHRDVSPQNVFVTYDGQVKLVDFGVAKTLSASHHTRPGTIKGKLAYMAPEQLQNPVVDRRADIFAVGVMLWEMLACRRMWHRMTEVEIVGHLASGRPLPALPVPADGSLPGGLDEICVRALHTNPDRRYQTAVEMEMDLERALAGDADSHTRNLGKVVAMAFATERTERQTLIERCVRRSQQRRAVAAEPATGAHPEALPAFDVPVDDLDREGEDTRLLVPPGHATTPAAIWWRRAATALGGLAAVMIVLLAVSRRHAPAPEQRAVPVQGTVAAIAPRAPGTAPARAASSAPQAFELLPPVARPAAPPSAGATPETGEHRHRRRHRAQSADDNATLPPSDADAERRRAEAPLDFRP